MDNGEMKGYCFGFEGPPGTGKTSLPRKVSLNAYRIKTEMKDPLLLLP